jgi:predicted enzyme related to lactoylglutathione lyase
MSRVVHFEISVDDVERAIEFYTEVFGWSVQKWEGPVEYWLVTTGPSEEPGIDGGIVKRTNPSATTVNTVDVASVDEFIAKIEQSGGKVVVPKTVVPGVGYLAYCQDPDGNTFGLMQSDPDAR